MRSENLNEMFPAVKQLLLCYYMQNFDITYGTFEKALDAFLQNEPPQLTARLLNEVEILSERGLIVDIVDKSSKFAFWKNLGGMRLVNRHIDIIRSRPEFRGQQFMGNPGAIRGRNT